MSERARNWCFTLNNYAPAEVERLDAFLLLSCSYAVYGKETGEQGTPHLQGYMCIPNKASLSVLKKKMGDRYHFEIAKGSHEQNYTYCTKGGDFKEVGEMPKNPADQGHHGKKGGEMEKERWAKALKEARETGEVEDAQIQFTHARTIAFLHGQELMKKEHGDTEAKHLWYWGESGTGKSRKARGDHPDAYLKMCNKWWDGYNDEKVVLIEDLDSNHKVLCHHLKIWADRYPFLAEKKGAALKIRPQLVIVTSNYHPRQIWSDPSELEPILRRFECVEFKSLK